MEIELFTHDTSERASEGLDTSTRCSTRAAAATATLVTDQNAATPPPVPLDDEEAYKRQARSAHTTDVARASTSPPSTVLAEGRMDHPSAPSPPSSRSLLPQTSDIESEGAVGLVTITATPSFTVVASVSA